MPGDSTTGEGGHSSQRRQFSFVNNLADELGLFQGQIVRAWVADPLPGHDEKIFINLKGEKTVAKTNLDVDRGDELIVQVRSTTPPIKLELFRPESARDQLDDETLERFLQDQDFSASEQHVDVARFLIDEHLPLNPRTIEGGREAWEELHDDEGNVVQERVRAMKFLLDQQLPVTGELVQRLEGIPANGVDERAWNVLGSQFHSDEPVVKTDWRELIRGIGIDLVRQIGKWPNSASGTIHARLLKQLANDEDNPPAARLLSQILGLALASIRPGQFWVIVPFFEQNQARLLTLHLVKTEVEGGWQWEVEGDVTLSQVGPVKIEMMISPDESRVTLLFEEQDTADAANNRSDELTKNLKALGLEVTIRIKQGEVEPVSPFSTRSEPELGGDPGKVDFTV